ncbi:MAG TPA: redoxin domain-containing protein, partial [Polyangiaceae bacterium]|nr:redoxin domain-containing protein [Polyangiaceae bacterium]
RRYASSVRWVCLLVAASVVLACSPAQKAAPPASDQTEIAPLSLYNPVPVVVSVDLDSLRFVGMDDGPVPEFSVRTTEGRTIESEDLVGDRAFVVVFFATWCGECDEKLRRLSRAVRRAGPSMTVFGVALDDARTWHRVPGYMKGRGLDIPLASALENPLFFISYNPFDTVPLVVIVGQNGGLVDYQLGLRPGDETRLVSAMDLAKRIGPLKSN